MATTGGVEASRLMHDCRLYDDMIPEPPADAGGEDSTPRSELSDW